jgi:hypothetical protein
MDGASLKSSLRTCRDGRPSRTPIAIRSQGEARVCEKWVPGQPPRANNYSLLWRRVYWPVSVDCSMLAGAGSALLILA